MDKNESVLLNLMWTSLTCFELLTNAQITSQYNIYSYNTNFMETLEPNAYVYFDLDSSVYCIYVVESSQVDEVD